MHKICDIRKIAVVGHFTYFQNHFPERWESNDSVRCFDVSEKDYSWLIAVYNYRPQLTIFFRPELYPGKYIDRISGIKVAILSEPLPLIRNNNLQYTDETVLRENVYRSMSWSSYHWRIYYDSGKIESAKKMGYPIDEYRPIPIDTAVFNDSKSKKRKYDVVFLGKPTQHRVSKLDFMRSTNMNFVWIAHGIKGSMLAELFQRSKIVLNIHADGKNAFEPRVYLAAACGAGVVTEPLTIQPEIFVDKIWEEHGEWNEYIIKKYIEKSENIKINYEKELLKISMWALIQEIWSRFK